MQVSGLWALLRFAEDLLYSQQVVQLNVQQLVAVFFQLVYFVVVDQLYSYSWMYFLYSVFYNKSTTNQSKWSLYAPAQWRPMPLAAYDAKLSFFVAPRVQYGAYTIESGAVQTVNRPSVCSSIIISTVLAGTIYY